MAEDSSAGSSRLLTCITCRVGFHSPDSQREHYKTDWHRYNLKRKVAALPPVTAEAFRSRVLAQRATDEAARREAATTYECSTCSKTFSTRNAHENHLNSKKHKDNEKRLAKQQRNLGTKVSTQAEDGKAATEEQAFAGQHETEEEASKNSISPDVSKAVTAGVTAPTPTVTATEAEGEEQQQKKKNVQPFAEQKAKYAKLLAKVAKQEEEKKKKMAAQPTKAPLPHSTENLVSAVSQQLRVDAAPPSAMDITQPQEPQEPQEPEAEAEEEEPVLELIDCMFDTYRADTFEENLAYMSEKHGFFVPHLEYVDDLQGLIRYLQVKVGNYFTCIYCNKQCSGLEAVRQHMADKGHKQVDYSEEGQLEICDYYDFSSTYPDNEQLTDEQRSASLDMVPVQDNSGAIKMVAGLELALPSGHNLGHRAMQRYYKQRFKKEDTRESVVIGRLASQYRMLGYKNPQVPVASLRREQARALRQQKRSGLDVALKQNNLQFHFRAQVMV
eukprot:m.72438 g.72438  ORF g.72438 m.72438 type:complete len:500 (+) comp13858_c0_seq1:794-2293(+)